MAKKQSQKKRPQKQKIEWRRVFVAGLAVVMALLLLLPMISMIAGGVGAVTSAVLSAHTVESALRANGLTGSSPYMTQIQEGDTAYDRTGSG